MPDTVLPIVVTPDVERLQRFYVELLDAEVTERRPDDGPVFYVGLRIGNSQLGLVANDAVSAGAAGRVLLSIAVDDVDGAVARVQALGGEASGANDMPWGQRVAHVRDPDGNAVNLTQQL